MTQPLCRPWRTIAWNGIRFSAPQDWELAELGRSYLRLADGERPVAEFKWGPIRGRFSPRKQLKRLARTQRKPSAVSLRPISLPPEWKRPLAEFDANAFAWKSSGDTGRGVILFCPACRNVSLIQFLGQDERADPAEAATLFSAYGDHASGANQLWSVFDIRARLPSHYKLIRHRLMPGEFRLQFGARGEDLILHRWSPASVLLKDINLRQFAAQAFPAENRAPEPTPAKDRLEWAQPRPVGPWQRLWRRGGAFTGMRRTRLWHLPPENRILAVTLENQRGDDREQFERICAAYEIVS